MSSVQYNPNPPRVWSRVQNPCSVIAYKNDDPGANSDFARADYERQMLLKGNILQYKKNSSNLTKKQRYTQIAKGMWTNRTKTWATQSDTYSNPNMTSLLRVNSSVLDPSNNTFSSRSNPFGCPTTEIQDGGNLVCNVVVDPCTQEVVKRTKSQQLCNPTTDSDVPGQIQYLCWNDGTQTWYPRQRYIMPTSGSKWPQGYKGFVSAVTFVGPVLSVGTMTCGQLSIPLSWTFLDSTCIPITSFNIYQNGVFILNVPVSQTTVNIQENLEGTYSFYITSLSNDIESEKSNTVIVNTEYSYSINDISVSPDVIISNNGKTITFLQNGSITFFCANIDLNVILVGGGAGGYSGPASISDVKGGGGGGAGETIIFSTSSYSVNTINQIIIGTGGNGGIVSGTHASNGNQTTLLLNTLYIANGGIATVGDESLGGAAGGAGGKSGGSGGPQTPAGYKGNNGSIVINGIITSYGGGSGAGGEETSGVTTTPKNGGGGGGVAINGINGIIPISGGQGGGGGGGTIPSSTIGGVYNGGNGGIKNTSQLSGRPGLYGGGGGGGASGNNSSLKGNGGNGGNGFCIIQIP